MNIFLIGITGVGKSVIGKKLARSLNTHFVDLDAYIQIREKMTIREMFDTSEMYFREAEKMALFSMIKVNDHVIATGGGIVENPENIKFMKSNGFVINLYRNMDDIVRTINIHKRPLLKDKNTIYKLYERRKPLYEFCADLSVDCSRQKKALEVIQKVIKMRGILGGNSYEN